MTATTTKPPSRPADPTHQVVIGTPIGNLLLRANERALTHVLLPNAHTARPKRPTPDPSGWPPLDRAVTQLLEYFAKERTTFSLDLEPTGTPFQCEVWWSLAEIPYGETISYAELAGWVGRPRAFRAVGQANGANPLPIVLPCHRVIASGGGLGGYGGGLAVKSQLLALEQ